MKTLGYVIVSYTNPLLDEPQYYALYHQSCRYPFWSNFITSAHIFKTLDAAKKILESNYFTKKSIAADGTIYPPHMILEGAKICNTKTSGVLFVDIVPLELGTTLKNKTFKGEIKKPKRHIYIY